MFVAKTEFYRFQIHHSSSDQYFAAGWHQIGHLSNGLARVPLLRFLLSHSDRLFGFGHFDSRVQKQRTATVLKATAPETSPQTSQTPKKYADGLFL